MRVLLVTHYFPPEVVAPQARLSETARQWAADGLAVTLLTGMPNHRVHLQAQGQAGARPADRAPGQGHEPEQSERAVHRLPLPRGVHQQPAGDARGGHFWANSAWLVCASMAFNLTRAAGTLASTFHAKATTGTIRAQLITVPGRLARSARRLTLHLPTGWPWHKAWAQLATTANSPPRTA